MVTKVTYLFLRIVPETQYCSDLYQCCDLPGIVLHFSGRRIQMPPCVQRSIELDNRSSHNSISKRCWGQSGSRGRKSFRNASEKSLILEITHSMILQTTHFKKSLFETIILNEAFKTKSDHYFTWEAQAEGILGPHHRQSRHLTNLNHSWRGKRWQWRPSDLRSLQSHSSFSFSPVIHTASRPTGAEGLIKH